MQILLLSSVLTIPAYAARVPDAGVLGNQLRQQQPSQPIVPVPPSLTWPAQQAESTDNKQTGSATVLINRVQFQGLDGTTVSEALAQQAIASFLNTPLNFADLRKMTSVISKLCHDHDMPLAQTVLPPQTIKNGILNIQVIPGRYDHPQISNQARIRDRIIARIARIARSQAPAGEVVLRSRLEHTALLLNDIPGITSHIVLQPGSVRGTSLLNIVVSPGRSHAGYLSVDNLGDPVTGRARAVVSGQFNNMSGSGDQLQVNLLHSYQKGGLLSGSADYSVLAGGHATRAGLNYSHLRYRYSLQGVQFYGYSSNWSLYVSHPWIRQTRARVDARIDGGQQYLNDTFPVAISHNSQRRISTGSATVSGTLSSTPGGLTSFSLRAVTGKAEAASLASSAAGGGHFLRFNYRLSHLQHLWGTLSLFTGIKGQLANSNMDSSQKLLLGGVDAVRAYDTGNGTVDDGYVMTAELRSHWQLPFTLLNSRPELSVAAFYDQGSGYQFRNNRNPRTGAPFISQDNRLTLAGAGLYMSLTTPGSYALTVSWARRTGSADPVSGYRGADRLWLSVIKAF